MKAVFTKKITPAMRALFEGTDAELVAVPEGDADAFAREMADADAVLLSTAFRVDKDVIDKAKNLKVVSRTGVGVDNVDVAAATARGILVLNTPAANAPSVAEHTVALVGALSKSFQYYGEELRKGNFGVRRENRCVDMHGKTLGLIGCGKIGRLVAEKLAAAYDMNAIGYDPFLTGDVDNIHIVPTIEEVLEKADYVSLHLPLNDDTRNLMNAGRIALMKPTAYLINTSRGGIVDEAALAAALCEKKLAGAGIDVFSTEPVAADNPLLTAPNAILTPHSAALTKECSTRVAMEAAKGIADFAAGKEPTYIFNKRDLAQKRG